MLVLTTLIALLCVGSVAPQSTCGTQQCDYPNQCENRPDQVSVCMRKPTPTCANVSCPTGQQCILQQDNCGVNLPCDPQPTCVTTNLCAPCIAPTEFCELSPTPRCRFVVEPRCNNKVCQAGHVCREVPLLCKRAPCGVQLICGTEGLPA